MNFRSTLENKSRRIHPLTSPVTNRFTNCFVSSCIHLSFKAIGATLNFNFCGRGGGGGGALPSN